MDKLKVLVADPISPKGVEDLKSDGVFDVIFQTGLKEEQLLEIIPDCAALVVRSETKVNARVLEAAKELGGLGADLYKAEVPLHGRGSEAALRSACAALTKAISSPWVVLSSGVEPDEFPRAVELACKEGASGFLAGRAVWKPVIGQPNLKAALAGEATDRLKRLCEVADRAVQG